MNVKKENTWNIIHCGKNISPDKNRDNYYKEYWTKYDDHLKALQEQAKQIFEDIEEMKNNDIKEWTPLKTKARLDGWNDCIEEIGEQLKQKWVKGE